MHGALFCFRHVSVAKYMSSHFGSSHCPQWVSRMSSDEFDVAKDSASSAFDVAHEDDGDDVVSKSGYCNASDECDWPYG